MINIKCNKKENLVDVIDMALENLDHYKRLSGSNKYMALENARLDLVVFAYTTQFRPKLSRIKYYT